MRLLEARVAEPTFRSGNEQVAQLNSLFGERKVYLGQKIDVRKYRNQTSSVLRQMSNIATGGSNENALASLSRGGDPFVLLTTTTPDATGFKEIFYELFSEVRRVPRKLRLVYLIPQKPEFALKGIHKRRLRC